MATTVYLPEDLLSMIDRRAKALRISRNRFILDALNSVMQGRGRWSPGFIAALEDVDDETRAAADELETGIVRHRRSKAAVEL